MALDKTQGSYESMLACENDSTRESSGTCENRHEVQLTLCGSKKEGYVIYKLKTPLTNNAMYCADLRSSTDTMKSHSSITLPDGKRTFNNHITEDKFTSNHNRRVVLMN